jgi:hypothetical protein
LNLGQKRMDGNGMKGGSGDRSHRQGGWQGRMAK